MKNYNVKFIALDGKVIWETLQAIDKNEALAASIMKYDLEDLNIVSIHIAEFIDD